MKKLTTLSITLLFAFSLGLAHAGSLGGIYLNIGADMNYLTLTSTNAVAVQFDMNGPCSQKGLDSNTACLLAKSEKIKSLKIPYINGGFCSTANCEMTSGVTHPNSADSASIIQNIICDGNNYSKNNSQSVTINNCYFLYNDTTLTTTPKPLEVQCKSGNLQYHSNGSETAMVCEPQ